MQNGLKAMNKKEDLTRNKIYHLEELMIMFGVYNVETLKG